MLVTLFVLMLSLVRIIDTNHFKGGMITWQPAPGVTSGDTNVTIIVSQRYSWTEYLVPCTPANITNHDLIGDYVANPIVCLSNLTECSSSGYDTQQLSSDVYCTDINLLWNMSSGEREQPMSLPNGTKLLLAFKGNGSWVLLKYGSPSGDGWSLPVFIDLTPRPGIGINHSPTSAMPFMVTVPTKIWTLIQVPMSDVDSTDVVRCRWSQSNGIIDGIGVDECAGACLSLALPSTVQLSTFAKKQCQLNVSLPSKGYYIVALQIEDFASNSSTLALSSVPLQFILYGFSTLHPYTSCTNPPKVTDVLPFSVGNGGNITVTAGIQVEGIVLAETGCINDMTTSISSFLTTSPPGMTASNSPYPWTTVPLYATNFTWTPTVDQIGSTLAYCVIAIDENDYMSDSYCINFLVLPQPTSTTSTSTTTSQTTSTSVTTTSITTVTTTSTTTSVTTSTSSSTTTSTSTSTSSSSTSTSTTSTSSTSTSTATLVTAVPVQVVTVVRTVSSSDNSLLLGLGLGLGLPLLCLLCSLALCAGCRSKLRSLRRKNQTDNTSHELETSNEQNRALDHPSPDYREQYINTGPDPSEKLPLGDDLSPSHNDSFASESLFPLDATDLNMTTTTFFSPSMQSLPTDRVEASGTAEQFTDSWQHGSILAQVYSQQRNQNPA